MSSNFDGVLGVLGDLKRRGELYIALLPPFEATFEISRDAYHNAWQSLGLDEADFKRELDQIAQMVQVTLAGEAEEYVEHLTRPGKETGEPEQPPGEVPTAKEIEDRIGEVGRTLVDERLRRRYLLKVSSKAPSFTNIDWDLKVKKADAKRDVVFPYATCKIRFQRDFELTSYSLLSRGQFDAVQINFTCDDVEYVGRVLDLIKGKLQGMEKEALEADGH